MQIWFRRSIASLLVLLFVAVIAFSIPVFRASATAYSSGDIIEFGSYPQSRVTNETLIRSLNAISKTWKSYNYYTGTGSECDGQMVPSDYMKYSDIVFGNEKYRAVFFTQYRPTNTGYISSEDTSNQDNNKYYTNVIYYFLWEPIKWRILDPDTGLVLSEIVLDSQPINNISSGGYDYDETGEKHYANNYAKSSIRSWLTDQSDNTSFLNTAFTEKQQNRIQLTWVYDSHQYSNENSQYTWSTTHDKIFLLSWSDMWPSKYGFAVNEYNDPAKRAKGSDYALCQGLWPKPVIPSELSLCQPWGLRSTGFGADRATIVTTSGGISSEWRVTSTGIGVRPALHMRLEYSVSWQVGEDVIEQSYKPGDTIIAPQVDEVEGRSFSGWTPEVPAIMPEEDLVFTAEFESKEYSITWFYDDKTIKTNEYYGSAIAIPSEISKQGYSLVGWNPDIPDTMPAKNMEFIAIFKPNTYYATLIADGVVIQTIEYIYGQKAIALPDVPLKTGFSGEWPKYTLPIGGVTIEAIYTPSTYLTTWNVEGIITQQLFRFGEVINCPINPQKTGCSFSGWNPSVPETMPAQDMHFVAMFEVNTYIITWNIDGTQIKQSVPYGAIIEKPSNPTKTGYSFTGWLPTVPVTMPAGDITFTAQFAKNDDPVGPRIYSVTTKDLILNYKDSGRIQLAVTKDNGAIYTTSYTGYDNQIVSVDSDGNVVALKSGSTTVKCSIEDNCGNTVECVCQITVKYSWWQILIRIFLLGFIWY